MDYTLFQHEHPNCFSGGLGIISTFQIVFQEHFLLFRLCSYVEIVLWEDLLLFQHYFNIQIVFREI